MNIRKEKFENLRLSATQFSANLSAVAHLIGGTLGGLYSKENQVLEIIFPNYFFVLNEKLQYTEKGVQIPRFSTISLVAENCFTSALVPFLQ